MWTILVIAICAVVSASEFKIEDNGWIPVSRDVVFQHIRHGFVQPPRYTKAHHVTTVHTDTEIFNFLSKKHKNEDNNEKNTRTDFKKQISQDFASFNDEDNENKPTSDAKNKFNLENILQPVNNPTDNTRMILRKSKKLLFDESFPESNENINVIEYKPDEDYLHTYEVRENMNVEEEIDPDETVEKSEYEYNRSDTKNLQKDLIKHLLKYNIKENDNLQNYALSRRPYIENPPRNVEYKPLHFKVPFRYNNLNHLLVDPLLAVYLSHYGHYLQGQYGIQNHYNNLYGYLASNNIHNNRPFGHYKLFSDNDSSQ